MSLNNFLCKHFEKDEEGNVTLGKIIFRIEIIMTIFTSLFVMLLRITPGMKYTFINTISLYITSFLYTTLIVIGITIIFYIISYISNIKVAKCPLNK